MKSLNVQRNEMAGYFIDVIAKRIMSLTEKHALMNSVKKKIALAFLALNMEKQFIALRLLYDLI